jgi:hypothetical protein
MIKYIASHAPLNRLGQVDEIAPVVSFLASPAAAWVNGQNILVNGVSVFVLASHDIELITSALGLCCIILGFRAFFFRHQICSIYPLYVIGNLPESLLDHVHDWRL